MAEMSKTNALFGGPQAGQPAQSSEGETAQPNAQTPDLDAKILAALEKTLPTVIDQALEKVSRSQQSQRDKLESRITERLNATLETLKASGVEVTPTLQSAIHQQVAREESVQTQSQPSQPAQGTAQHGEGQQMPFDKFALRDEVFEMYGVKLEAGDPEVATFVDSNDPAELMRSLKKAVNAKKERLSGEASGRLPVVSGSGPRPDLERQYQEELSKIPRGDVNQFLSVKAKYRKMGLANI